MKLRIATMLFASLAVTACDHKKKEEPAPTPAPTEPAPTAPTPTAPTPTPTAPTPTPAPAANNAGEEVRETVAADLAWTLEGLPGEGDKIKAVIKTSEGTLNCELFADKAPLTVANWVGLATGKKAWMHPETKQVMKNTPFYDGLTFHRVINNFMIQGGDPLGQGIGGPGYTIAEETRPDLKHLPGTLSMAKTMQPHSTGSQFFVMEVAKPDLDNGYSVFGQCKEVDVVKKITALRGPGDRPTKKVTIDKVEISRTK
jgi:peptidyl-prolyl cis-trans isomerase A (cyclophilin A)